MELLQYHREMCNSIFPEVSCVNDYIVVTREICLNKVTEAYTPKLELIPMSK